MAVRRSLWCSLAVLILAPMARAQDLWPILFPELTKKTAPAWLKPGVRMLYKAASATIRLNPNDRGASGAGYTTVDVIALDKQHAVLHIGAWTGPETGTVGPLLSSGAVVLPGSGGDWWLHPSVLPSAPEKAKDELRIVRMPCTAGGRQYQAMRFQYDPQGARHAWMYDMETGILLTANSRVGPEEGDRTLSNSEFLGMRQVEVPWADSAPPAWVATWPGTRASGVQTVAIPGAPPMQAPVQLQLTPRQRGGDWIAYDLTTTSGGFGGAPPQQSTSRQVVANRSFAGLWVPPAAMAELRPGQVIDDDPALRVRRTVEAVDGRAVTLREQGQAYMFQATYDRGTGRLIHVLRQEQSVATTTYDIRFE